MSIAPCTWNDGRYDAGSGRLKGFVTHKPTGRQYERALGANSNCKIRRKCLAVSCVAFPILPIKMILRALFLVPYSIKNGYQKAHQQWMNRRVECFRNDLPDKAPGHANLAFRVAGFVLWTFFKDAAKLITLPLAALSSVLAGLWGTIFPLDGLFAIGSIEDLWSIDIGECGVTLLKLTNYTAPCMQSREVADRLNFYRFFPDYSPKTVRSLLLAIDQEVLRSKAYFSDEDYVRLKETIEKFRSDVTQLTPFKNWKEAENLDSTENKSSQKLARLSSTRDKLYDLLDEIKNYKEALENTQKPTTLEIFKKLEAISSARQEVASKVPQTSPDDR